MTPDTIIYLSLAAIGFLIVGIIGKRAGWFKIISGTNRLLKEQNSILTEQNVTLKDQTVMLRAQAVESDKTHNKDRLEWAARHNESLTEIAKLQGKVETLTQLPLKAVNDALQKVVEISQENAKSNQAILQQLQKSAVTLAEETHDVAVKVGEVKEDLKAEKS